MTAFAKVLDSADRLPLEEQEELAETLRRRIAEKRRAELVHAVKEARDEFSKGRCKSETPDSIVRKIFA